MLAAKSAADTSSFDSVPTVRNYIAEALAETNDDPASAQNLLIEWAEIDEDLADMLLQAGASQLVRTYYTDMRRSASSISVVRLSRLDPNEIASRTSARIARREFWDSYTLYGHQILLRSATKRELEASILQRREQARGGLARADFEEAIKAALKNNRVRSRKPIHKQAALGACASTRNL